MRFSRFALPLVILSACGESSDPPAGANCFCNTASTEVVYSTAHEGNLVGGPILVEAFPLGPKGENAPYVRISANASADGPKWLAFQFERPLSEIISSTWAIPVKPETPSRGMSLMFTSNDLRKTATSGTIRLTPKEGSLVDGVIESDLSIGRTVVSGRFVVDCMKVSTDGNSDDGSPGFVVDEDRTTAFCQQLPW